MYTVSLWYLHDPQYHDEHPVYTVEDSRTVETLEDACAAFVSFVEIGEQTRPHEFWVEIRDPVDDPIVDLISDGRRKLTVYSYPQGLEAARALSDTWTEIEVMYTKNSDDPALFAQHLYLWVGKREWSIDNAISIFRQRCKHRLYTTFTGYERSVKECCRIAVQYGGLCDNVISTWEPVKTTDACIDTVNYI